MTGLPFTTDALHRASQAAEQLVSDLMRLEDCDAEPDEYPDTAGPWCGCPTCDVRETLHAALPILLTDLDTQLRAAGYREAATFIRDLGRAS